jgi:hypothetical protein
MPRGLLHQEFASSEGRLIVGAKEAQDSLKIYAVFVLHENVKRATRWAKDCRTEDHRVVQKQNTVRMDGQAANYGKKCRGSIGWMDAAADVHRRNRSPRGNPGSETFDKNPECAADPRNGGDQVSSQ